MHYLSAPSLLGLRRAPATGRSLPPELMQAVVEQADSRGRMALAASNRAWRHMVYQSARTARSHVELALQLPPLALRAAESRQFVDALYLNAELSGRTVNGDRLCVAVDRQNVRLFAYLQKVCWEDLQYIKAPSHKDPAYAREACALAALCAAGLGVLVLAHLGRPQLAFGAQALFGGVLMLLCAPNRDLSPATPVSAARFLSGDAGRHYAFTAFAMLLLPHLTGRVHPWPPQAFFLLPDPLDNTVALAQAILLLRQGLNCISGMSLSLLSFTPLGGKPIPWACEEPEFVNVCDRALQAVAQDPQLPWAI